MLKVTDEFTRECLAIRPRHRNRSSGRRHATTESALNPWTHSFHGSVDADLLVLTSTGHE